MINQLKNEFETNFNNYNQCAYNSIYVESYINEVKNKMLNSFKAIYTSINAGLNLNNQNSYPIVTTKSNYDSYTQLYADAYALLSTTTSQIADVCLEYTEQYKHAIENCLSKLYFPEFSTEKTKTYTTNADGTEYHKFVENSNDILTKIEDLKAQAQTNAEINNDANSIAEIKNLISNYYDYSSTYANLIKYELLSNALECVNTKDKGNLLYLEDVTTVNTNSWLVKYKYLFNKNQSLNDYANPLAIGTNSNANTNGYDYAYFILKMFSFVIIAYAIMAGAHTIAGEIKEGTMRYLAIRPVKRSSILFGKFLAIAIMSAILITFSGILSVIVGGCIYSFRSATILTVFAGKYAITLHPIAMIVIYLFSLFLELLVYLSIALLLSTFIKSDILAVTILMVVYLVNILLPMFSTSSIGWLSYYPFSHISLYALFGSALFTNMKNPFSLLLGVKVYPTTSLILTLVTTILIITICSLISSKIFKHKEV